MLSINLGGIERLFSNNLKSMIHMENIQDSCQESVRPDCAKLREACEVNDSTIRKRLHKYDLFGRLARREPLLSEKNTAA